MKYKFYCDECQESLELNIPMSEVSSKEVLCPKCGNRMHQNLKNNHLVVPEHMRANQVNEMSYINSMMKTRPSGKTKTLY